MAPRASPLEQTERRDRDAHATTVTPDVAAESDSAPVSMRPGTLVAGRYRITQLLGEGGMGKVYEAVHVETSRKIALKLLAASDDADCQERHARFAREAKAVGQIRSAHVVEVYDAGISTQLGMPFMAMEFLTGVDVHGALEDYGPLPPTTVIRIAVQALRGLKAVHAAGVVHRDIKPANLFLVEDGSLRTVKVLDFGVARLTSTNTGVDLTQDLTRTGAMIGSPAYMAPEQIRGFKDIDARADIWSLSVTLYKLLAGRTPHVVGEGGIGNLMVDICAAPAPRLERFAPWVPNVVCDAIHRGLVIDPSARYTTEEMLHAFEVLAGGDEIIRESDVRSLRMEEQAAASRPALPSTVDVASETSGEDATELDASPHVRPAARAHRRRTFGIVVGAGIAIGLLSAGLVRMRASESSRLPSSAVETNVGGQEPARAPLVAHPSIADTTAVPVPAVNAASSAQTPAAARPPSAATAASSSPKPASSEEQPTRAKPAATAFVPREIATHFGD